MKFWRPFGRWKSIFHCWMQLSKFHGMPNFSRSCAPTKKKLKNEEKIRVGENVSAIIQRKLPQKCKDPGMFTIPCVIGNHKLERAMLDLGASINVMPLSIYKVLNLRPLKETKVIIQLADRSNAYPEGIVEDVLVRVNELIFPVDFYIIDMDDEFASNSTHILLDRPFMKIARTKIDVHKGTLSFEFDGEIITFNIFYAMKYPEDSKSVFILMLLTPLCKIILSRIS